MNTCTKCGNNIVPNSVFCIECGTRIELPQSSYQPPQPPQQYNPQQPPQQYNPQQPPQQYNPQPHPTQYGYQQPHYVTQRPVREPGRKLIFVVSILLTIFGALGFLFSLSGFGCTSFSSIPALEWLLPDDILNSLRIHMIFETISGVIMLTFGICGIVMSKDSTKANFIMIFGVILLALNFFSGIWSFVLANEVFYTFENLFEFEEYLQTHPFIDIAFIHNSAVANTAGIISGIIMGSVLPSLLIIGAHRRKKGLLQ